MRRSRISGIERPAGSASRRFTISALTATTSAGMAAGSKTAGSITSDLDMNTFRCGGQLILAVIRASRNCMHLAPLFQTGAAMTRTLIQVLLACTLFTPAFANGEFPATLAGHAVMPAETFIDAPADAPADLKVSGKFTEGRRVEAIGTVMGKSAGRPT